MNKRIGTAAAGFSLLEVLIVILVIAFGIIATLRLQGMMVQDSGFNAEQTIALSLAEEKLEDCRIYASLGGPAPDSYAAISSADGDWEEEQIQLKVVTFTRKWRVRHSREHGEASDYKEVEVVVEWRDAGGRDREVQFASVIAGISPVAMLSLLARFSPDGQRIRPYDRTFLIPNTARDMGDYSLYTPPGSNVDIESDNLTGQIIGGLDWLPAPGTLDRAVYLISGYIEVSDRPAPSVMQSWKTRLVNTNTLAQLPQHQCWDDSQAYAGTSLQPQYAGYISYACVVQSSDLTDIDGETFPTWSGSLRIIINDGEAPDFGWAAQLPGSDGNNPQLRYYKICRYNHTPASYSQVHDVLANQNYLVFEAGNNPNAICPAGMQQHLP